MLQRRHRSITFGLALLVLVQVCKDAAFLQDGTVEGTQEIAHAALAPAVVALPHQTSPSVVGTDVRPTGPTFDTFVAPPIATLRLARTAGPPVDRRARSHPLPARAGGRSADDPPH